MSDMFSGQLTTHFTLNTLGGVQYLIRKDPETASERLQDFIDYMKYSVSYPVLGRMVSYEGEKEYLEYYRNLMEMRFGEHFRLEITESKEAKRLSADVTLPAFILQRLVENAFYHGIRDMEEASVIKMDVYTDPEDGLFCIRIEDKGKGMDVEEVMARAATSESSLFKIREAIEKSEGKISMDIKSTPGAGCSVLLRYHRIS